MYHFIKHSSWPKSLGLEFWNFGGTKSSIERIFLSATVN